MTLTVITDQKPVALHFTEEQITLIKDHICKGASDAELEIFLHACRRTGLDPFMKQIYAVPRYDNKLKRNVFIIQTAIDGFRLIADRTGKYSPGREPTFQYKPDGSILSATSYVKKLTADGTWHEISASAYFDEYCQWNKDYNTGQQKKGQFWERMPHVMISKVAEALALRKSFPAELSGIYTADEMEQAESLPIAEAETIQTTKYKEPAACAAIAPPEKKKVEITDRTPINASQLTCIETFLLDYPTYKEKLLANLKTIGVNSLTELPAEIYEMVLKTVKDFVNKEDEKKLTKIPYPDF